MTTSPDKVRTSPSAAEISASEDVAIFSAFTLTATLWLLLTTAVGLLLSFKFTYPDLVAYLKSLRQPPLPAPSSQAP